MTDLPEPLVPPEVDLRDFAFMPLDVQRLRDSDLASDETPEACWAAVLLWCAAWHQVPAASIPDSDEWQAKHAGYKAQGKIAPGWRKVKAGALRGWIKCDDGRLYHPVIAEKAADAWTSKLMQRWRTECSRIKKHNQRHYPADGPLPALPLPDFDQWRDAGCPQGQPLPVPSDKPAVSRGQGASVPGEKHSKGQGQGQGQGQGLKEIDPSGLVAAKPRRPTKKAPDDFELTDELRSWAAEHTPGIDPAAELAKLKDHTFATARVDWPGTLRNWLRKAQEGAAKHRQPARPSKGADEPEWRRRQREHNEAFLGPAAAKRAPATIEAEAPNAAPDLLG